MPTFWWPPPITILPSIDICLPTYIAGKERCSSSCSRSDFPVSLIAHRYVQAIDWLDGLCLIVVKSWQINWILQLNYRITFISANYRTEGLLTAVRIFVYMLLMLIVQDWSRSTSYEYQREAIAEDSDLVQQLRAQLRSSQQQNEQLSLLLTTKVIHWPRHVREGGKGGRGHGNWKKWERIRAKDDYWISYCPGGCGIL